MAAFKDVVNNEHRLMALWTDEAIERVVEAHFDELLVFMDDGVSDGEHLRPTANPDAIEFIYMERGGACSTSIITRASAKKSIAFMAKLLRKDRHDQFIAESSNPIIRSKVTEEMRLKQ